MKRGSSVETLRDRYGVKPEDEQVDICVSLMETGDSDVEILRVGGRFDIEKRDWVGEAREAVVWRMKESQYEAAYWFADWLDFYCEGIKPSERESAWKGIYTLMCEGGRGGGKSGFACRALLAFGIACRDRILWGVSPAQPETEELRAVISGLGRFADKIPFPGCWGTWLEDDQTFYLWNGSVIRMLSGFKPSTLKRGRVDGFLLNEGQRFQKRAYTMARPRLVDTGGIGLMTVNPPDEPKGRWVMEFHDRARAGKIPDIRVVHFDAEKNDAVDFEGLDVLRHSMGDKEFRREVKGEFIPVGDLVHYGWSDIENVRPRPQLGRDITRQVTEKVLGRAFDNVIGMDFQLAPHEVAEIGRFYEDPEDPSEPLLWWIDSVLVEGTEDDLVDGLELRGYEPDRCGCVCDASGVFQGSERIKGRGSWALLQNRGWIWLYRPDPRMKKNPLITERVKAYNARICNGHGKRRVFGEPHLEFSNRANRDWENRNGAPYKKSEFAHVCDARGYVAYRFFPRVLRTASVGDVHTVKRVKSSRERDLDEL